MVSSLRQSRWLYSAVALTLVWTSLLLGCNEEGQDVPQGMEEQIAEPSDSALQEITSSNPGIKDDGHDRILRELKALSETGLKGNSFFDPESAKPYEAALAQMGDSGNPGRRFQLHRHIGMHSLRFGETDKAIEHLEAACALLPTLEISTTNPKPLYQALYQLAVAHLRKGEQVNCIHGHNCCRCIFPLSGAGIHEDLEGALSAKKNFREFLFKVPNDLAARWLLTLTYMALGETPPASEKGLIPVPEARPNPDVPRLVDVAAEIGLNTFNLSGGVVADDFDGDGDLDILTSTIDPHGELHYFTNDGKGMFVEKSEGVGIKGLYGGLNMVHADYDNDGHLDVLILRGAWFGAEGRHPNSLLRNLGDGSFLDVTYASGLGEVHYPTQTASWSDYDLDGDLDIYIGNEHDGKTAYPGQLFQNRGDGTFVDVAAEAGVINGRFTKSVVWGDYDGDRYPDLFISNLNEANRLYRNLGDGKFEDVAEKLGLEKPLRSFPSWFFDYNQDGHLDLFVSGYWSHVSYYAADQLELDHPAERACLYKNDGNGGFNEVGELSGLQRITEPMGANFGDLNGDGYPDFYLGTGYPELDGLMPNVMYLNLGGEGFLDVTVESGMGHLQKGHGIAFADLDHDGDQDVFAQMGGAYPADEFYNATFRNPGFGNRFLIVRLKGNSSNRFGMGSRVRARILENGKERSVYRWINSGGSFGCNPLRAELGLGSAEKVLSLEVYWPKTDVTQFFEDVPLDAWIEVEEGAKSWTLLR